jgi:hypothetical protein
MFYHCLYTLFRHKYLILVLLLWGCSSDPGDSPIVVGDDPDEVTVTFSAGNSSALTRAPFSEGDTLKIYVYRSGGFSAAPYKVVEGKTGDAGSEQLSPVILTGGDITAGDDGVNRLTVRGDFTYDFIVVVNASPGAQLSDLGTLNSGMLTGFSHGADILSGRAQKVVALGESPVEVKFTEYGADDGNLPHLCSAVVTEARVTEAFITYVKSLYSNKFDYQVAGMDFRNCLPKSANLSFSGDPMALTVLGSATSYSASILGDEVEVDDKGDKAESEVGVLLPCPLQAPGIRNYNVMSIDFRLRVNGAEVTFPAANVHVPEFKPGYRYRFIVEMDKDNDMNKGKVNLLLSVESWSAVSWDAVIGGGEDDEVLMQVTLGSWSSVSWQSVMGDGGTDKWFVAGVSGWSSATWMSEMGEN